MISIKAKKHVEKTKKRRKNKIDKKKLWDAFDKEINNEVI